MKPQSLHLQPVVIIDSPSLENIKGKAKASGNDFSIFKQTGYLMTEDGQRFPEKISFLVDEGKAYPKGDYHIDFAQSLETDGFDGLKFKPLTLIPFPVSG